MKIEEWERPGDWEAYPEMEEQIWEIQHFKKLCLFLKDNTDYSFEISFDDETCIYVTVFENNLPKAECYVNRGDSNEALFSIYSGEEMSEFHSTSKEKILNRITSSEGYLKQDQNL